MNLKLTPEKLTAFLTILADTANVTAAANAIGVARQTVYAWRESDAEFAAAWQRAEKLGVEGMKDEVKRRAFDGVDEPVFYQGAECGTIRKYSDTLAMFLIKAHDPAYRDSSRVDIGNADGKPFEISDADAATEAAKLIAIGLARKAEHEAGDDLL
ncbi:terminase [Paraburkholderia sartisoli]|uniref:Phage terminase small subunit n=1 Tax=Paraburkholderia sartisoli TaxID=83784 RepID=A0A1H4HUQ2_9BURK|nr:terminase [Paraburkholderia sartisoli]SEB24778.1 hypothetical protein SAMN05192564_11527 [Paraburkholderia sartisoli]